jgi:hypothetical protein
MDSHSVCHRDWELCTCAGDIPLGKFSLGPEHRHDLMPVNVLISRPIVAVEVDDQRVWWFPLGSDPSILAPKAKP